MTLQIVIYIRVVGVKDCWRCSLGAHQFSHAVGERGQRTHRGHVTLQALDEVQDHLDELHHIPAQHSPGYTGEQSIVILVAPVATGRPPVKQLSADGTVFVHVSRAGVLAARGVTCGGV